jgi:hypothetical protein
MRIEIARGTAAMVAIVCMAAARPAAARGSWRQALTRADSPVCAATYARALERAREGRLKDAGELFGVCARAACSEATRRECLARRAQLDADTPSLVPLVTDDAGEPRLLVEVRVDGTLVTSRLDGRALPLDPGKHELTFSTDAGVFATRHLMVVQGERNRAIHVVLHAAPERQVPEGQVHVARLPEGRAPEGRSNEARLDEARPAPSAAEPAAAVSHRAAPRGRGAAPYLLGALGLAGVGGFGLLTYWGRADNALLADCAPRCTDGSVRHVRNLYWGADASLGVGLVSLAISTALFAARGPAESSATGPLSLDLRPARAGGVATVVGRF